MAEMVTFHESEEPWVQLTGGGVMDRTGGRARRKTLSGADAGMFVSLGEYDPNLVVEAHSHSQPEVMYILEGDVVVVGRHRPAGTVLRIPAETVYGPLQAGPRGVRFLTIRPGPTRTFIPE